MHKELMRGIEDAYSFIGTSDDGLEITMNLPKGCATHYVTINGDTRLAINVDEYGNVNVQRQVKEYRWVNQKNVSDPLAA